MPLPGTARRISFVPRWETGIASSANGGRAAFYFRLRLPDAVTP
ncbi:MAG TPA: hypothetical protein VFZ21_17355 [Gemmatimonadaceae bacterium]|jgi:hypothetical protein|nr:hypothetical protein [Gemmatimonadaceae bacterium]